MKNTFGNNITITLFGESHGEYIGAVLDGIAPGTAIDEKFIKKRLASRRPAGDISTDRVEADDFNIISGVFDGNTTGAPLCILISNGDRDSSAYLKNAGKARPGHADYSAYEKYFGYEDYRGGGHFSGRLTAALVAAGAVCELMLKKKNIAVGTHVLRCGGECDRPFGDAEKDIALLEKQKFPTLSAAAGKKMTESILAAKRDGDSVGGVTETVVTGVPAGIGEPWFDTFEGMLSHAMFSIPAIKGVQFGAGFGLCDMRGSEANDAFALRDGKIVTETNNAGGINGGISNGMPILFSCAVKPTPSIAKEQKTVNFLEGKETTVSSGGRHDPAIVHRACSVVTALTAIVVCDMLASRYGTDFTIREQNDEALMP